VISFLARFEPESVEEWLLWLHQEKKLAWTTINKVKHAMQGVFKFGRKKQFLPADFDPFQEIDCEASSDYEAITCTPEQTLAILNQLDEPEFILTLLIAATGLSISEALGLQWADVRSPADRGSTKRGRGDRQLQEYSSQSSRRPSSCAR
jgi:integrase